MKGPERSGFSFHDDFSIQLVSSVSDSLTLRPYDLTSIYLHSSSSSSSIPTGIDPVVSSHSPSIPSPTPYHLTFSSVPFFIVRSIVVYASCANESG